MDGLKPGRGNHGTRPHARPAVRVHKTSHERHSGEKYWLVRSLGKVAADYKETLWNRFRKTSFAQWPDKSSWHRLYATSLLILFLFSVVVTAIQPLLDINPYKLNEQSRSIIPRPNGHLSKLMRYNAKEAVFTYNEGYQALATTTKDSLQKSGNGDARFSATLAKEAAKGVKVTDAVNNVNFTLKPKYRLGDGKQDANQIMYPLRKADGFLVYTAQIASIKEDIVLQSVGKDTMRFEYELGLEDGLEARLEKDGSVGVYGTDLPLYGNVSTGSDKDAELLQKAKQNAKKNKFLFGIPAPVVKESGVTTSSVRTHFELDGNKLIVVAESLKKANYPLTIDPSVYIQSAAQLMYGNNESNVAFDVATEQFKKGFTTGARINEWTETGAMNDATYDQGVAGANSYVYRAGGRTGRVMPWIASQQTTTLSTPGQNFVMNMPTVRPAGDLYVAVIARDGSGAFTAPGGWTQIASTQEHLAYWRVGTNVSGGNEAATYTWSLNSGTTQWAGVILRIKNYDSTAITSATGNSGGGNSNVTYPTITLNASGGSPSGNGALVIRAASIDDDSISARGYAPTNHDIVSSAMSGGSSGVGYMVSKLDSPLAAGSSTGTATAPSTENLSDTWGASTFAIYGNSASPAYTRTVQWAHFNSTTGSIDSPAPGSNAVACTGWCTNSAYDLPSGTGTTDGSGPIGGTLTAYNGYLYYIGGSDGTDVKNTVYIAKLGTNGEPSLWHPTDPDQVDWVYWYKDTGLNGGGSGARAYHSVYAYNGKIYVIGGDSNTTANSGAKTTVEIASILPNGTLGSWSAGTSLGTARYGATVQGYNGYLYVLGGNNNGTMITGSTASTSNAIYTKINADGTLNSWQLAAADGAAATFNTPRFSGGGVMSGIWGGYIYLAGGCSVVNGSGICTTVAADVQLASINSDGSLDVWNTMANLRNARIGSSFIAWQGSLYRFGGCSNQDASSGDCYSTHIDIQYGPINQDGDASTVSISTAPASGNCVEPDPYDCSLPPGGTNLNGQILTSTAIMNGFIYVIGGCTTYACDDMSSNTSYASIDSNGRLKSAPTCAGSTNGAWCIDDVNTINGANGVGGAASTVFGGYIYVVGGRIGNGNLADGVFRNKPNADGSLPDLWVKQKMASAVLQNALAATSVVHTYAYARANPASAGTIPGNLFIFGGCTNSGCTTFTDTVYKCKILSDGSIGMDAGLSGPDNRCLTTSQQQIGTVPGASGAGLGGHSGAVYANYVYLVGGIAPGTSDLTTVRYAKFDNSNNIVAVSGSAWVEDNSTTAIGRRMGGAFGYNGYLYAVGGYNSSSSTLIKDIQFAKINVSDGSIDTFSTSVVSINQRWGLGLVVSNSYAYVIGGCKSGGVGSCASTGGIDDTVQTFQMYNNDSGAPAKYTSPTGTSLYTTDRIGAGAAVYNGYIYIAGGCTSTTDCTTATDNVQFASIDANGAIGAWANTTDSTLPAVRAHGQLEVVGGTLYFIGGQGSTATDESADVFFGTPSASDGQVSSWSNVNGGSSTGDLPVARTKFSSAVWNNRIYVTGGLDNNAAVSNVIYASPVLSSGGDITSAWTTTGMTAFTIARTGHVAITYANNLYILGGYDGTNYLSDVQFAKIDSSGTVGSWTYTTSLPSPIRQADGFAANGYMYIFGGRSSLNDCAARTLIAPISANTTIASGNNPTGIGEWYQTNRNFDGGRYGLAATYYQGKAYLLGGGCEGIVMQDDFDSDYTPGEWSTVTNFAANTDCQSTSSSNTFRTNSDNAFAATKAMDVSGGGTVYFKLYIPLSDIPPGTPTCYAGEGPLLDLNPDNVSLQYCTAACGSWTTIGGAYNFAQQDPLKPYVVTLPAGAQTTTTKLRWTMLNGEATDSFALEDVYVVATGNNTIAYATNSRVTQTALLSQPQIAIYSRQIDAGADVFPTNWLMNGIDNSIGARWQMAYRSMNDPLNTGSPCGGSVMTSYGQITNSGDVTLGMPGTYTVKNSGGTNIGCGRYFFMTISIDASQTYGYPDDIDRGPTLDNLSLFYKSNPGKRLIHGKTFTEGIQQPLDTPCSYGGVANNINCPLP